MRCYICWQGPTEQLCSECRRPICVAHRTGWKNDLHERAVSIRCKECRVRALKQWSLFYGGFPHDAA